MSVNAAKTVRELVLEIPEATRVFEKVGVDYCCGGGKSLEEACATANLPVARVLDLLESAMQADSTQAADRNWQEESLSALVAHITTTHHTYTHEEIARLSPLLDRVVSVHGGNHPELRQIQEVFREMAEDLITHMRKEEAGLFPFIVQMEKGVIQSDPASTGVENPVAAMTHDHDAAGNALRTLRQASGGYTLPPDACGSYHSLYRGLADLEKDLHQHIHLENNILFPRAVEMSQTR